MAANPQMAELPRQLRFNLQSACSYVNNNARQVLEPFEITPKQYDILRLLQLSDPKPLSIQSVRDQLADKMSDASRLIDRLHKKGLLEKTPSDIDRRSNLVKLSKLGHDLMRKINKQIKEFDGMVEDKLDSKQIDQLNKLLEQLVR